MSTFEFWSLAVFSQRYTDDQRADGDSVEVMAVRALTGRAITTSQ